MPLKLHLKTGGGAGGGSGQPPPTPSADTPAPKSGGSSFKLKLSNSQPPTPATEQSSASMASPQPEKKKRVYHRKDKDSNRKRPAEEDAATPAAKRVASDANNPESRRSSMLVLKGPKLGSAASAGPSSAGPKLKLNNKQKQPAPVLTRLNVKGRVPDRIPGNGYDSEDSDREKDPATEQQLILRMQPGEDCDILRDAIAEKKIGVSKNEGGVDVTLKFIDRDFRRAVVGIKGRMYAAALVDMPCIVETMKSWDKKGWWKVTDVHQMLLVLGRCSSDEEARNYPLPPRVVNPSNMQYAHGLTPPMHHVRKRRFRKRLSYKDTANVEEEVQRLLEDDDRAEAEGGEVTMEVHNRDSLERSLEPADTYLDEDADADADAIGTIEDDYNLQEQLEAEMDVDDVAAQMNAAFDEDAAGEPDDPQLPTTDPPTDSPAPLADAAASFAQSHLLPADTTPADTPAHTPAAHDPTSDEDGSDYDDDDDEDEDGIDVVDEDAAAQAAERAQQMEEVKDLEREVEIQRQKLAGQKNQLLREKTAKQLRSLEEDLRIKRDGLGMGEDEG